ncbi:MAG: hypothetical protein H0X13_07620 [Ramlibacter sp.]|nr:hypothetical protein [Ramlibacter sp.]
MNRWLRLLWVALLLAVLQACASINHAPTGGRIPIPGGSYSWGTSQKVEDFSNVEIAQSRILMYSDHTSPWKEIFTSRIAMAQIIGLQSYFPMQARWRLKDGREFVLKFVDQEALVRDYLKTHELKVQWEREGRKFALGDALAKLTHDIKDDALRLKWVVTLNRTPVSQRLRPGGAANPWTFEDEEHVIAVIKGVPASGIDFTQTYDSLK